MLKELIEILRDIFLRYKRVRTFKYQDDLLNNAQAGDKSYQIFVDDQSYHRLNITTGIFIAEFNIAILRTPSAEESILDIQSYAYDMACNVLEKLDYSDDYVGVMRVHDYSIVTVSHVTDNDSAGVRLTVELEVPNPANLCDDSHWNDEPYSGDTEFELSISGDTISGLDIKPVVLPRRKVGC